MAEEKDLHHTALFERACTLLKLHSPMTCAITLDYLIPRLKIRMLMSKYALPRSTVYYHVKKGRELLSYFVLETEEGRKMLEEQVWEDKFPKVKNVSNERR